MEGCLDVSISALVQVELAMLDKISSKFRDMYHFGGSGIIKDRTGEWRFRYFQEIRWSIHGIHILMQHTPHMPALTAKNPFNP
jgi:hypothetical protein